MQNKLDEIKITYKTSNLFKPKLDRSNKAYKELLKGWDNDQIELLEEFKIILLNNSLEALGVYNCSRGGTSSTIVEIKHIIFIALKTNSSSIIIAHNHPSGNTNPSKADLEITKKINEACKLMGLYLQDHIIVTKNSFYSFADNGII